MNEPESLYFGYGSNLDLEDWEGFCAREGYGSGLLVPVKPARLVDYELAFTKYSHGRDGGVLDIRHRSGFVTPGMLFEVRGDGWAALDRKEGAPSHYRRRPVTVLTKENEEVHSIAYEVTDDKRQDFVEASSSYVEVVRRGLTTYGLDARPLEQAAANERAGALDAVFVYGTLMRGELRYPALRVRDPECILLARTAGRLVSLGNYPGLLPDPDASVRGELFRLGEIERLLHEVDPIEGFRGWGVEGNLYRRILVDVDVGDRDLRPAWTYEYQGEVEGSSIESGCWREHTGQREEVLTAIAAGHGDPENLLRRLATSGPFSIEGVHAFMKRNLPLWRVLASWELSEHDLAQASGRWVVEID